MPKDILNIPTIRWENDPHGTEVVVWGCTERSGPFESWRRISFSSPPKWWEGFGLCVFQVESRRFRQSLRCRVTKRFARYLFQRQIPDGWRFTPNGDWAEPMGDPDDSLLVVCNDHARIVRLSEVQESWPNASSYSQFGPRHFLVEGVSTQVANLTISSDLINGFGQEEKSG